MYLWAIIDCRLIRTAWQYSWGYSREWVVCTTHTYDLKRCSSLDHWIAKSHFVFDLFFISSLFLQLSICCVIYWINFIASSTSSWLFNFERFFAFVFDSIIHYNICVCCTSIKAIDEKFKWWEIRQVIIRLTVANMNVSILCRPSYFVLIWEKKIE